MIKGSLESPLNTRSLSMITILGIAPIVGLNARFDVTLFFSLTAFVVALLCAVILHFIRDIVSQKWITAYAMLIAGFFVSIAELVFRLVAPELGEDFGIYLPLLSVSPLILLQIQLVRNHENFGAQLVDTIHLMGRFTLILASLGLFKELVGSGTLTLFSGFDSKIQVAIPVFSMMPIGILASAAGGIILLGLLLAFRNWMRMREEISSQVKGVKP